MNTKKKDTHPFADITHKILGTQQLHPGQEEALRAVHDDKSLSLSVVA